MKRPKKRLRKKYYKKLAFAICYCVSQTETLRKRFFEIKEREEFDLSDSDLASASYLTVSEMATIRKFCLRFTVAVNPIDGSCDGDGFSCVDLCFGAKEFPGIFSGATIFKGYEGP